jgi:uncharacterized cofD-like protein
MFLKWFAIGIGVKRWLIALFLGICLIALGFANIISNIDSVPIELSFIPVETTWVRIGVFILIGLLISGIALLKLSQNILAPYRRHQQGRVIDVVHTHSMRQKGAKIVTIGGGTGLPSVLRGIKSYTSNITAIVTVADDGGSSGRLRRELGVLPPGDMRNNIAALADDESLMTQLFQYRFKKGALRGHAFGNLFIAALAGISGGLDDALPEVERVLNIQGRVLPSTLADVNLIASVYLPRRGQTVRIRGESKISKAGGKIEEIKLSPPDITAYSQSIKSILDADLVVIGPGSLYTSILPNLLVAEIADALRTTQAYKAYVCNVATQPGETEDYDVADHVLALEKHIGRGMFQAILANNAQPSRKGSKTVYVELIPSNHDILQRYEVRYTDLSDIEHPWRHDPHKLARALVELIEEKKTGVGDSVNPAYINTNL